MNQNFKDNGYCLVKSVVSDELKEFITQYALFDELQNLDIGGDWMVPTAHSKFGDPAMETLLLKFQPILEEQTGLELIPTYSYFRVYRNGDELAPHQDRDACEISCTVSFDYSYSNNDFQWPIFMDGNPLIMDPGDLVVYRGIDLKHWREKLVHPDDSVWHVQGFFHYVNANGPHKDQAYDCRPGVGHPSHKKQIDNRPQKSYLEYT